MAAEVLELVDEPASCSLVEVGEGPAGEHHGMSERGSLPQNRCDIPDGVCLSYLRSRRSGQSDRSQETFASAGLLRPRACLEPPDGIGVVDIDGRTVEAECGVWGNDVAR